MTTLAYYQVKRGKGYRVMKGVSGDLSYGYDIELDTGRRMHVGRLTDVPKAMSLVRRYGAVEGARKWYELTFRPGYSSSAGYLRGGEARKLARSEYAYGDYVEKIRRRVL
jgi:hypothetical protein